MKLSKICPLVVLVASLVHPETLSAWSMRHGGCPPKWEEKIEKALEKKGTSKALKLVRDRMDFCLPCAVKLRDDEFFSVCLEAGADPSMNDDSDGTLLFSGDLRGDAVRFVEPLIEAGIDVNFFTKSGAWPRTALSEALDSVWANLRRMKRTAERRGAIGDNELESVRKDTEYIELLRKVKAIYNAKKLYNELMIVD